jgi:hypothetical protein
VRAPSFDATTSQARCGLAHERLGDTPPARLRSDVEDVDEAEPRALSHRDHQADGGTVVLGEQHDALADRTLELGEILGRVVVVPLCLGDLDVELVHELAHELQVFGGGGADHGTRCASRR